MKIAFGDKPPIIIGKRVTIGAMLTSVAAILAHFYPNHAPAIVASVVPVTFIVQVIVVNVMGVTTGE